MASIKTRYSLCKPGTAKETVHVVIDLGGSGIEYAVGDSIAVLPSNDPVIVKKILDNLGATGGEKIDVPKKSESTTLESFLTYQANLSDCTLKFAALLCRKQTNSSKKETLRSLLEEGGEALFKEYQQINDVLDVLECHKEVELDPQEFCETLKPMMPRFYSIASSMKAVGEEVHLTVALQKWDANGKRKVGVCTHFLCNLAPLLQPSIPVYIHPHRGFTLPENPQAPIIMIGPGTGIAPFRAFMQERERQHNPGKSWLFFGEWNRDHHFFYEDFWRSLQDRGIFIMDLAFSRDQSDKVYVQHKMRERGEELFRWLQEGAFLYVCGDAGAMARDVDAALHNIVQEHGNLTEEKAVEYMKALRKSKRYLRDVY